MSNHNSLTTTTETFLSYPSDIQELVIKAIIQDQEIKEESLSVSCRKHNITKKLFIDILPAYPKLKSKYDYVKHKIGALSHSSMIETSLTRLVELSEIDKVEKIEYKWVDDKLSGKGKWVKAKKTVTDNTMQQERISKFILEKIHNDFNPKLKEIRFDAAMGILKQIIATPGLDEDSVVNIQKGISNYLRSNGLEVIDEDIDEDSIIDITVERADDDFA